MQALPCNHCGSNQVNTTGTVNANLKIDNTTFSRPITLFTCAECSNAWIDEESLRQLSLITTLLSKKDGLCWICKEKPANTSEHSYKSSMILKFHNRDRSARFADPPIRYVNGKDKYALIQGPDSKQVKYKKSLCRDCNNSVTQPHDRVFDTFLNHVLPIRRSLFMSKSIDFRKIPGLQKFEERQNFMRYFAKDLGCAIVDAGYEPPRMLGEFITAKRPDIPMVVEYCCRPEIARIFGREANYLGKGPLQIAARPFMFSIDRELSWIVIRLKIFPDYEGQITLTEQINRNVVHLTRLRNFSTKQELGFIWRKLANDISLIFKSANMANRN